MQRIVKTVNVHVLVQEMNVTYRRIIYVSTQVPLASVFQDGTITTVATMHYY